ncbi:transposase [Virgibacillus byunsanensis]|uniref:Transposase n=1 Tax=Virgibacillus byunsanensis TaxID=570945 RepID=A0ABW3LF60_9BACI
MRRLLCVCFKTERECKEEQLKYISRYIRRPAIALGRIEEYDGEYVTFKYMDKMDGKEKRETIPVEEFIGRLIRHIPDEKFKKYVIRRELR